MVRREEPEIAAVAGAMGEPARAMMLMALLGGEPLAAGALARRACVAASTASGHLAVLVERGLVRRSADGRRRMYELADEDVASALEALARIAGRNAAATSGAGADDRALRFARTCYDHLAGTVGVLVTDTLVERGLIAERGYALTAAGEAWLEAQEVDVAALRRKRRSFTRPCLDWSERRDHLAGAVGAAVADAFLARRWLVRLEGTRALRLTLRGREGLYRSLRLELP